MNLFGLSGYDPADDAGAIGVASRRLLVRDDPTAGTDPDGPLDDETATTILGILRAFIAEQVADLRAMLGEFEDRDAFRARVALAASVDSTDEGKLLLRYEATHDRSLRASIAALIALEKSGADLAEPDAPTEPIGPNPVDDGGLGEAPAAEVDPSPAVDVTKADRDRGGRVWGGDEGTVGAISERSGVVSEVRLR